MLPTTIRDAPLLDSFTTLAEHQSQTPTTFFGAKPVLHYHASGVHVIAPQSQTSSLPIFKQDEQQPSASGNTGDDDDTSMEEPMVTEVVDIYVNSENLTIFNTTLSTGISLPYPAISLHAIQTRADPSNPAQQVQGLYMQLDLSDPYAASEEDEFDTIELTIIPTTTTTSSETSSAPEIQKLFEAVSNCSNLHPDPAAEGDEDMEDGSGGGDGRIIFEGGAPGEEISGLPGVTRGASDGGLPPPFPGSGGWFTAENVSEYFDEEGNWIGGGDEGEGLGEGAGRVRARDEVEQGEEGEGKTNGDTDESKRPRME
ncbi:regulator of volume decrease after cellular swelling-domain-containing protein [Xylogone sp. PMI_703]|nr:regulator of volume decrease after cellular swelling-domain-containing protein [Xylogone sp. PMI_703]